MALLLLLILLLLLLLLLLAVHDVGHVLSQSRQHGSPGLVRNVGAKAAVFQKH